MDHNFRTHLVNIHIRETGALQCLVFSDENANYFLNLVWNEFSPVNKRKNICLNFVINECQHDVTNMPITFIHLCLRVFDLLSGLPGLKRLAYKGKLLHTRRRWRGRERGEGDLSTWEKTLNKDPHYKRDSSSHRHNARHIRDGDTVSKHRK